MTPNPAPAGQTDNANRRPNAGWTGWVRLLRRYTVPLIAAWGIVAGLLPLLPLDDSTQKSITDFYNNLPFPIPKSNACLITSAICISYWAVSDLKPAIDDLWETITTIMFKFKLKPSVVERETAKIRAKALAEGHAEGHAEGAQEQNELWQAWLQRMQDARSQGIEFNEPPPGTTHHINA